ncbi:MAG: High-affinity K+ transporter ATPase chain B [Rhodobacter sp.]|nr:High-affinity K+ transporter ATPase chain B [Rhodobacter sp.]
MRKLLFLLIFVAALWSGYWVVGSSALRNGAEEWFAEQSASGMTAEKTALTVRGFPNRFDLTVEGLRLADPQTGIGWEAPFAQLLAMTWKPWHIIAALPPQQTIRLPDEDIGIESEGLRASLRAKPATDLPLAAVIVESGAFLATSTLGWTTGADAAVASIVAVDGQSGAYDLALDVKGLAPDPALMDRLTTDSGLPGTVAVIRLLARATLTAPLDRNVGETQPQLAALQLTDTLVTWGDLSVVASGSIAPDAEGYAAGRIEIAVTNWERLVPVLVASGAIKPELSQTVQNMLAALAKEGGDPAILKLPLVLAEGRMSLGPLPLGPAPLMQGPTG